MPSKIDDESILALLCFYKNMGYSNKLISTILSSYCVDINDLLRISERLLIK